MSFYCHTAVSSIVLSSNTCIECCCVSCCKTTTILLCHALHGYMYFPLFTVNVFIFLYLQFVFHRHHKGRSSFSVESDHLSLLCVLRTSSHIPTILQTLSAALPNLTPNPHYILYFKFMIYSQ